MSGLNNVNKPFRKKDAMQLVTGQPVYMDDLAPKDCLIVKLLRSPHANAMVKTINTAVAKKVPGIEAIFTWEDVPQEGRRFTQAGQTYPEASPYDRLVIDRHVRFVGDVVAIVAGKDEACVNKALKLIKVEYEVLEAVLDYHTAKDNPILVHPEDNWESLAPVGADNRRNLCAHDECGSGDIDAVLEQCDVVIDHVYHTKACQQAMMETFRTSCWIDLYGRLNVLSSTQIVFHARRHIANALHIPKSMVRVTKPRIGGGFGAKQTSVSLIYPAFVTWKTKKPSKILFTREESQTASSPRHEMEIHLRLGATKEGIVKGIDMYTLSNTGAYGEHGPTTVGLSGHKSIPLYAKAEAFRFTYDVVYTNHMSAGAYRGYGATQGLFAVESAVNELAARLHMDPFVIREKNIVREGDIMPAYYGAPNTSCALDRCLKKVHDMIGWEEKYPRRDLGNGKIRAVGMGMALAAWQVRDKGAAEQDAFLQQAAYDLAHARPTTANRYGQITYRCAEVAKEALAAGKDPVEAIVENTVESLNRRYSTMQIVGDHLAELIPQGGTILTQCFGETIIGTVIRAARRQNKDFKVFCAETRPYLQGARLTSGCFAQMGFDTTVITDNMVAYAMEREGIDLFTSAADTIARDGHIANKIGTFQIAILAKYFGIPYYVTGIPDQDKHSKDDIVIEMRDPQQVLSYRGIPNTVPEVKAIYPSFDVVPPHLISGVVTDKGVYVPYLLDHYFDSDVKKFY